MVLLLRMVGAHLLDRSVELRAAAAAHLEVNDVPRQHMSTVEEDVFISIRRDVRVREVESLAGHVECGESAHPARQHVELQQSALVTCDDPSKRASRVVLHDVVGVLTEVETLAEPARIGRSLLRHREVATQDRGDVRRKRAVVHTMDRVILTESLFMKELMRCKEVLLKHCIVHPLDARDDEFEAGVYRHVRETRREVLLHLDQHCDIHT
jgi:hypothetical protein